MLDHRIQIGEDAQRAAIAVKHVSRTLDPLDGVPELFAGRPVAVCYLDDFIIAEVVPDSLGQVGAHGKPCSIKEKNRCPHDVGSAHGA